MAYNRKTQLKLFQGALGTVRGFVFNGRGPQSPSEYVITLDECVNCTNQPEIPIVLVQMDDVALDPETNPPFSCDPETPNLIPFVAVPTFTKLRGRYYRWQLPLRVAHCRTIHKAQGLTAHNGLVFQPSDVAQNSAPFALSLEYVGLSRPKHVAALWLRGGLLTERHIAPKPHRAARRAVEAEYQRLATALLRVTDPAPDNF